MEQLWTLAQDLLARPQVGMWTEAILKVLLGIALGRLAGMGAVRLFAGTADAHQAMLLRRITFYVVFALFAVSAAHALGFDLGVLLGAAGILTVAIGFASQTSASNLISGLFLLGEKPFAVGDIIRVGTTTGEVLSIDLLSVKLRTFDNLFVRLPNETMIKSEITNLQRFPIRRLDLQVGVAYNEDMRTVRKILLAVADANPLCLEEPRPLVIFQGFQDSALGFQLSAWTRSTNFLELRTMLPTEIKEAFDAEGVEIPFPHRTLYTGEVTKPFPIQLVEPSAADADDASAVTAAMEPDADT